MTALPTRVSAESISVAATQFREVSGGVGRVKKGWLVDATDVSDYDPAAFSQIQVSLETLALYGLRYVAFVHPNEIVRGMVASISVPLLRIREFATVRDAEGWFRRSCT